MHSIVYSTDPDATRAFFRDVLGFDSVDAGDGWLIFALPPAELGVHPADQPGAHELFFMCKDIEATVADLRDKGVEFETPIEQRRFGSFTAVKVPGAGTIGLYEPTHASPLA
jgi:catechol 2,3-dioxygenase-like lactoylglutathione lyase family enzyme